MDLRLSHLRTLAAVVRHQSFSKAAAERRLTQPAVSQHVRALETSLGHRLIERVGKRAYPTPAAEILLDHAGRMFEEMDAARQAVERLAGAVAGRVRLGTGATASIYLLPPILGDLRRRFPALEISVATGDSPDMAHALIGNDLDLAVVTLPVPRERLRVAGRYADPLTGIAAPGHPFTGRGPLTPKALAAEPFIHLERGSASRAVIDHWFRRAHRTPRVVMELGSAEAIKRLVGAGLGVAILPGIAVAREMKEGTLAVLPLKPPLSRQLGIVHRKDKVLTPALQIMVAALVAGLKPPPNPTSAT